MMMFSRFDICLHREGNRNSKYFNLVEICGWAVYMYMIRREKIHRSEDIQLFVHEQMLNKNGH